MMHARVTLATLLVGALTAGLGCDMKPLPPLTSSITPGNSEETAQMQKVADTQAAYKYRLQVLDAWYTRQGNHLKQDWARNESKNLREAQTFAFKGVTPAPVEQGPTLDTTTELSLVEPAVAARRSYLAAVDELIAYYQANGPRSRARDAQSIRNRFDPIRTYMYYLDAEVPPADLKPVEVFPEAEQMYGEALRLHKEGKILPLVVDYDKERRALLLLLDLIKRYPTSTRIAEAAYYIGDIYKEYFDEDYRAVLWYERAIQWDPNITKPARFQAATVYDLRMHHRAKAIEMYQQAILHEPWHGSNIDNARHRIEVLSKEPAQP